MTAREKELIKRVNQFLFGEHSLNEIDLKFQLDLEEKILSLKDGESLYWYTDYDSDGNLFEMWKTYTMVDEWGRNVHPFCGPGHKSGIKIKRESGGLVLSTKKGYGANWVTYSA